MADVKKTKAEKLAEIKAIVEAAKVENEEELIAVIDGIIASDEKKKESNAKARAKKKEAGDELRAKVEAVLTDEFQTREQILAKIDSDEELSVNKITPRLTQLVNLGKVVKEQIKPEGAEKSVMAYKLA